jgi:Fur family zinc uptake transcriptional regulator
MAKMRKGFPEGLPFTARGHDHATCVAAAVDRAAELCARRRARLTPLRRLVLELVWRSHEPVGAYAILETLRAEGRRAAPPTVYRALEFLLAHGLVHRIESLNAFVGCIRPGTAHGGQFLICGRCGAAAEINDGRIDRAVKTRARALGFEVNRQTIELAGLCPRCRKAAPRGHARNQPSRAMP